MILNRGEKIHIIRRRNFIDDPRRHFIGEVKETEGSVIRLEGYIFVFDVSKGEFLKKARKRATIINPGDSGYIVNVIPTDVDIERLVYERVEGSLVVTDGKSFFLDINEFGANR